MLRAFASIGVWPGQAWLHLAAQYTSFLLDLSASTPPSNHKRSLRHAPLSGQQLSMVFSCLSQYGRYTKAFPLRKLLQQVAQQCTQLSPQDFSSILVGLAHMKANPPRQWVDAVCGGMSARLPAFSSSQLALTWWALGRLCAQPPQPFVAAALYHTTRHLSDLSSGELVAMMTGVCACIKPGHEWMELVLAEVILYLTAERVPASCHSAAKHTVVLSCESSFSDLFRTTCTRSASS